MIFGYYDKNLIFSDSNYYFDTENEDSIFCDIFMQNPFYENLPDSVFASIPYLFIAKRLKRHYKDIFIIQLLTLEKYFFKGEKERILKKLDEIF